MAYRTKLAEKAGRWVEVRSYLDLMNAELGRARLGASDIPASVVQATSFNPLLVAAAGGHRLMVDASDFERAEEILRRVDQNIDLPDEEPAGALRCPRCEGAYCSFGRIPLRLLGPSAAPAVFLLVAPFWVLSKKRWYCDRCEHVWDDPAQCPKTTTPVHPTDPRPVFLLWRGHAGLGLFLGVVTGLFASLWIADYALKLMALVVPPFLGWFFGRVVGAFVCSEPSCRAPLARHAESCARCQGVVAGSVRSGGEHFAALADFRRELAAPRPRRRA